jgi:hypothetical protein
MYYAIAAIAALIALWLIYLFFKQLRDLGQYLKWKHPFFYRIYTLCWILSLLGASTVALVVCGDAINSQKYTTSQEELNEILKSAPTENNFKTPKDYQIALIEYGRKVERESRR